MKARALFPVFDRRRFAPGGAALGLILALTAAGAGPGGSGTTDSSRVEVIFENNTIHFLPEEPRRFETDLVKSEEDGRVLLRGEKLRWPWGRILAEVTTRPIPKDELTVHDKWDRAGNVRLAREGGPDIEVVKFITAYGGETTHRVDVTDLAPFLAGEVTWKGFVDTWSSPGWKMDFKVLIEPDPSVIRPAWGEALFHEPGVTAEQMSEGPLVVRISIPTGLSRVELRYLTSGHCTDGMGADEFETKDHVISVDGAEAFRFRPWRDDCLRFRAINPYCRRWSDGTWSSDYDRSGWCPGDKVDPVIVDLTERLGPGEHTITVEVLGIRPKDAEGHLGYWRVSAYLLGWARGE